MGNNREERLERALQMIIEVWATVGKTPVDCDSMALIAKSALQPAADGEETKP